MNANYCPVYQKFILEELVFTKNLLDLHYGNCSVIGRIQVGKGNVFLENIRLECLEKKYQYNTGEISIRILDNLYQGYLPNNQNVEIFGKVILYDVIDIEKNQVPITAKDVRLKYLNFVEAKSKKSNFKYDETIKQKFNIKLCNRYEVAIQLHFLKIIDLHNELTECNLQIRMLSDMFTE